MDVSYPGPVALTDWKSIGASLEKVIEELALLTSQFASMNNCIATLESFMAASTSPSNTVAKNPAPYIPSSMQGWDDVHPRPDTNVLVDINSPPLQSTTNYIPIPQFTLSRLQT
ncbi:unnamed protein product [Rhizophagus irregularis]|nr:unnamed protein product [Rhizophagus irregularis]